MSRRAPRPASLGRFAAGLLAALVVLSGALAQTPPAARADEVAKAQPGPQSRQILVMMRLAPDHMRGKPGYGGGYDTGMTLEMRRNHALQIAKRHGLAMIDGWPMPLLHVDCYVMQVPDGKSVEQVMAEVSKDPEVAWSEPMQLYRTQGGVPQGAADPLLAAQPAAGQWQLSALHRVSTGKGVVIAVVDSRVEVAHPDLAGQFVANEDFVINGSTAAETHGTGVAGIIAAKADNGLGIAGVAPGSRLMALRACWQVGAAASPTVCDSLSLARAINFAIEHKAQVINLSLSGPPDPLLDQLLTIAKERRISVVAAFDPDLPKGGFPASQPGVIAVADKTLSPLPALVYGAPGRDIPTTQPGGKWYLVNGSSYAAAHVSGLIALARQLESSPTLVAAGPSGGVIDACATLQHATPACVCDCAPVRAGTKP